MQDFFHQQYSVRWRELVGTKWPVRASPKVEYAIVSGDSSSNGRQVLAGYFRCGAIIENQHWLPGNHPQKKRFAWVYHGFFHPKSDFSLGYNFYFSCVARFSSLFLGVFLQPISRFGATTIWDRPEAKPLRPWQHPGQLWHHLHGASFGSGTVRGAGKVLHGRCRSPEGKMTLTENPWFFRAIFVVKSWFFREKNCV